MISARTFSMMNTAYPCQQHPPRKRLVHYERTCYLETDTKGWEPQVSAQIRQQLHLPFSVRFGELCKYQNNVFPCSSSVDKQVLPIVHKLESSLAVWVAALR